MSLRMSRPQTSMIRLRATASQTMKAPSTARRRQRGAALLIMMLVVLVAATAVLVTKLNSNDARARSLTDAQDVLAQARQALLDYAAVHPDLVPGETARLMVPPARPASAPPTKVYM